MTTTKAIKDFPGLELLGREHFNSYESGQIIAGIKHTIKTDLGTETHDCYQFNSFQEVIDEAVGLMNRDDVQKVEIVTHAGEYKKMRALFRWVRGSHSKTELTDYDPDTDPRFAS